MRESVFEAYLEDGEELLWEGFYYRPTAFVRDFDSALSFGHVFLRRMWILSPILASLSGGPIGKLIYHQPERGVIFILSLFIILLLCGWYEDRAALKELWRYEKGNAEFGLTYAVTSRRLLAYDFATKRVFRELRIHSKLTVIPTLRGASIDASRATAWVWPIDGADAAEATKTIREVRDRMKPEAA